MPIAMQYGSGKYTAQNGGSGGGGGGSKYIISSGTTNGWDWDKWSDGTIDAYQSISGTQSNATSWNNGSVYNFTFDTPFTMSDDNYYVSGSARIGSGYGVLANVNLTTTGMTIGVWASQSGSRAYKVRLHLHGTPA